MIWWQVPGSSLLSDLIAAGAFVLESHPFLSNAPPGDGLVELVPLSGRGVKHTICSGAHLVGQMNRKV